tara:strand:- start:183 stop:491 length:309 start_codon:yes stop_codon:yes gene_type:complete
MGYDIECKQTPWEDIPVTDDFRQRVEAAKAKTKTVTAPVSKEQMDANPEILLIETRLKENVPLDEQAENVIFMSVEELDEMAEDRSKLDPRLADPNVQIITT